MLKVDSDDTSRSLNDLGHLASAVGHNIINAFSAIVSNAELLRLKAGPNTPPIDASTIADMIIDTALDASTVARRLIDFTRPITSIGVERVALHQLIADYIESSRCSDTLGIVWSAQLAPMPPIFGEPEQLEEMLDLLVTNARDARTPETPLRIHFETSLDARGWVTLEIRDSGQGMTQETLERAVEPFYSTKSGHIGIGLSIANGIWRRHRGTLSIRSNPEGGVILRLCVEPCTR